MSDTDSLTFFDQLKKNFILLGLISLLQGVLFDYKQGCGGAGMRGNGVPTPF